MLLLFSIKFCSFGILSIKELINLFEKIFSLNSNNNFKKGYIEFLFLSSIFLHFFLFVFPDLLLFIEIYIKIFFWLKFILFNFC